MECEDVDWIHVATDWDRYWPPLNTVVNLRIPWVENLWSNGVTSKPTKIDRVSGILSNTDDNLDETMHLVRKSVTVAVISRFL
jgi:hypothetical protein